MKLECIEKSDLCGSILMDRLPLPPPYNPELNDSGRYELPSSDVRDTSAIPLSLPKYRAAIIDAKCHVWTAPAVQGKNLTFQRSVRVQPCIRPLNAAVVAAGPDVFRRSGPKQSHALKYRVALNGFSRSTVSTVSHQCRHHPCSS